MSDTRVDGAVYADVRREFDIDQEQGGSGRVPADQIYSLLESIEERTGDDVVGLKFSPGLTSNIFTALFERFHSFETLLEVFEFLEETYHLVMNGQRVRVRTHGSLHFAELLIRGRSRPGHEIFTDYSLAGARELFPRFLEDGFAPLKICLRRSEPEEGPVHEEMFDCPVVYDHPTNLHSFRNQPVRGAGGPDEPSIWGKILERLVPDADGSSEPTFVERVEGQLTSEDDLLEIELEGFARNFHVSPRTLQRRLREAGVSFRLLCREELASRATDMLLSGVPQKEVGERLGYSEPPAFVRGFHRWLGMYPSEFLELNEAS